MVARIFPACLAGGPIRFLLVSLFPCFAIGPSSADSPTEAADYLREHARTRGFLLGRPVRPKPTPDGKAVLFLRGQPRSAQLRLYEFDVAARKTRELLTPEQVLNGAE